VGIMSFNGEILLKPTFKKIVHFISRDNERMATVIFDNDEFFYIDKNAKCVEYKNHKCPE